MPSWKKVITSGSNAHLNQITASSFNLLGSGTGELEVEGNITASGNISSSGNLYVNNIYNLKRLYANSSDTQGYIDFDSAGTLRLKIANSDSDVGTTFFGGAAVGGGAYGGGYIDQTTGNAYQVRVGGNEKLEVNTTGVDVTGHITASQNISSSGTLTGAGLNVIGTSNLDAVDIDGTVQIDGATTFGVNGTGVDAKFFGGTSGRFMKWVTSTDVLHFTDNASIAIGSHATETTGDMLLYHDGTNSVIKNHSNVSTTELQLVTNAGPIRISGSSTQRSLIINQHITSSGNISSTGNLDVAGIISGSTALNLGYKPAGGTYISASSDGVLEISGSGNATLSVEGHITSSGNVKVAGDVEANGNIVGDNSTNITGINEVTVLDNINLAASKKITWVNDNSFLTGTDTSVTIDGDSIVNFYADQRFIFHDSNVGILTADQPQPHALTVTGEISSSGFISSQGAITGSNIKVGDDVVLTSAQARIQNTSAETSLLFGSADSAVVSIVSGSSTSVTVPFYFDTKNQRMGIKTALPTVPLQVEGTISGSTIDATTHKFSKTGTTDATHQGDVVYLGGTTSMDPGKIYHYKSDGTWELADADAASTSDGLLGVALGAASDTNGMLLRGMVTLDHDPGAVGDVLFLATGGTGQATATAPSGGSDIIRVIGYCLDASNGQIWFNPDNTFVEHS